MDTDKEFQAVKAICDPAVLLHEGGKPVVLLPDFSFQAGGKDMKMDLLLHPSAHLGYATRLFFKEKIGGRGQNWNQHQMVGRAWWAPSWQGVSAEQSWPAMLCAHLRGVA
ncbi:MAG: hypothetical protein AB7E47_00530 [Desulfovibrionaceae bacterium]